MTRCNVLSRTAMAVLAALAASMPAGAAAERPPGCASRGTTVVANDQMRIFQANGRSATYSYNLCRTGAVRGRFLFDSDADVSQVAREVLAIGGRFVTYWTSLCDSAPGDPHARGACRGRIVVHDTRRRRTRVSRFAGAGGALQPVTGVVVTARGWTAWTQRSSAVFKRLQLRVMSPSGSVTVLDEAEVAQGEPGEASLAVSGDRIYWQFAAEPRSRVLR